MWPYIFRGKLVTGTWWNARDGSPYYIVRSKSQKLSKGIIHRSGRGAGFTKVEFSPSVRCPKNVHTPSERLPVTELHRRALRYDAMRKSPVICDAISIYKYAALSGITYSRF